MFDRLNDDTLRDARAAARLLYRHHRILGLDSLAAKLDTLCADISNELESRGEPVTAPDTQTPV